MRPTDDTTTTERPLRVAPRPSLGLLATAIYLAVFYGAWMLTGIRYSAIGESERTLWLWYALPLAVGAVPVIVMTTALGWWRPALFERRGLRLRRAWLVFPVVLLLLALANLLLRDLSAVTPLMWLLLVAGSLLVGFNEELVTRGLLLVGLRGRYREPMAWFLSTLVFGLMHLPNWVFGAGPIAVVQVGMTFLMGTLLYVVRRSTGSLIWAILLHGLWDFSVFAGVGDSVSALPAVVSQVLGAAAVILLLVSFAVARRRATAAEPAAEAPAEPER